MARKSGVSQLGSITWRERLFAERAATSPTFAEYQRRTTRVIPVVVLQRLG
jgi:F420H(2)-dependent quinone reductase